LIVVAFTAIYKCVFVKYICPTLKDSVVALFVDGVEPRVVTKVLTVVTLVTTTLEANVALFPDTVRLALMAVFAGTAPKRLFTVMRFDVGVPFGSSTIRS